MKRIIFIFVCILTSCIFITSCSDDDITSVNNEKTLSINENHYVSYEDALKAALSVINGNQPKVNGGRKAPKKTRNSVSDYYEYTYNDSDSSNVRFHVFNFDGNEGFVLVSADNRTTPIFAYSDNGTLDIDQSMKNTSFKEYMEDLVKYYKYQTRERPLPFIEVPDTFLAPTLWHGEWYRARIVNDTITTGPLISATWNQTFPYNYYCPAVDTDNPHYYYALNGRAAVGCVPVAIGQIMSYHEFPSSYNNVSFDWNLIKHSDYYLFNDTSAYSLETAKLLRQTGICANVVYGYSSSSNFNKAKAAFTNLGYNYSYSNFSQSTVLSSVQNRLPVYIRGEDSDDEGHAWVIDGISIYRQTVYYYTYNYPYTYCFNEITDTNYFHCNWGWGGLSNGFYLSPFSVDDDGGYHDRKIIYNILPNV